MLLAARQLGFGPDTLFIGGNGSNSPKLGEIAGKAADGLLVGSPWFVGKDDAGQREVRRRLPQGATATTRTSSRPRRTTR